jgi:hypothetical protein
MSWTRLQDALAARRRLACTVPARRPDRHTRRSARALQSRARLQSLTQRDRASQAFQERAEAAGSFPANARIADRREVAPEPTTFRRQLVRLRAAVIVERRSSCVRARRRAHHRVEPVIEMLRRYKPVAKCVRNVVEHCNTYAASAFTAVRIVACRRDRGLGRTTICTSWPSAFRKRYSRSRENPLSRPRKRSCGWVSPVRYPARLPTATRFEFQSGAAFQDLSRCDERDAVLGQVLNGLGRIPLVSYAVTLTPAVLACAARMRRPSERYPGIR